MNLIINYGWRSAFIATGVVGIIWIAVWLWIVKEKEESREESSVVKDSPDLSMNLPESKFSSVLLSKNFIFIALCGFATYWSFTIGLNWLPNYLENVRQLSAEQLQMVVALPWILITLSQITFSTISDRMYRKTQNVVKARVFVLGPVMLAGAACYFLGTMVSSNYDGHCFTIPWFNLWMYYISSWTSYINGTCFQETSRENSRLVYGVYFIRRYCWTLCDRSSYSKFFKPNVRISLRFSNLCIRSSRLWRTRMGCCTSEESLNNTQVHC